MARRVFSVAVSATLLCGALFVEALQAQQPSTSSPPTAPSSILPPPPSQRAILNQYCVPCHNERNKTNAGGMALDTIDPANVAAGAEIWERVVRKLRWGLMPPPGRPRP